MGSGSHTVPDRRTFWKILLPPPATAANMSVRASLSSRYDGGDNTVAVGSLSFESCDGVLLRASLSDATIRHAGSSLEGLQLSLEKPGAFAFSYDVSSKDARFQFTNTIRIADMLLHMTYAHARKENRTVLDGALVLNSANKISGNYAFGSGKSKLKYTYIHGDGSQTFEPCYDFSENSWNLSVSQRVFEDDFLKASYETSSNVLKIGWMRNSMASGSFQISASLDLKDDELKMPKFTAETTWNLDL